MAEYPALPLFTDAFIGDTTHLDAAQTGAYLMLLMIAWRTTECALPDDDKKLARWARMQPRAWVNNKSIIMSFWQMGEDRLWRQRRLSDERTYVEAKSKSALHASKSRWLNNNNTGNASASPTECGIDAPTPTPTPTPQKEEFTSPLTPLHQFEKFWAIFPKQRCGNKQKSLNAYLNALERENEEIIIAGVISYAVSDEVTRGYAKGAAAWLNDDRWKNDYYVQPTKGGTYGKSTREEAAISALKNIHHRGMLTEQDAGEDEGVVIENNPAYLTSN